MDISLARTKRLKTKVKKRTLTNRIINQNMFFFAFLRLSKITGPLSNN